MTPLAKSVSCLDLRTHSNPSRNPLASINSSELDSPAVQREASNLSQSSSMSTSMMANPSMNAFRRQCLSLNTSDVNLSSINAYSSNGPLISSPVAVRTSTESVGLSTNELRWSGDHDSPSSNNVAVRTPSAHSISQDDLVTKESFGFHPIMERMTTNVNNNQEQFEKRRLFFYYLDQLLGMQCHRITTSAKREDGTDNIYDVDTVSGAFIWKNELRKHWVRSRIERRKLMAPKKPVNPFVPSTDTEHILRTRPATTRSVTTPLIQLGAADITTNDAETTPSQNQRSVSPPVDNYL